MDRTRDHRPDDAVRGRVMVNIGWVAQTGSSDEFFELYESGMASTWRDRTFGTLLECALTRSDVKSRVELATRLLDDGADASVVADDGGTTAHTLLDRHDHIPQLEAPLLERLFDGGADLNRRVGAKNLGTPLKTLTRKFKFSDEFLAPLYDVFFSRDDLDLVTKDSRGISMLETIRRGGELRPKLLRRAEQYLRAQGIDPDEVE